MGAVRAIEVWGAVRAKGTWKLVGSVRPRVMRGRVAPGAASEGDKGSRAAAGFKRGKR